MVAQIFFPLLCLLPQEIAEHASKCRLTVYFTHQLCILTTMGLSPELSVRMVTPQMSWSLCRYFAHIVNFPLQISFPCVMIPCDVRTNVHQIFMQTCSHIWILLQVVTRIAQIVLIRKLFENGLYNNSQQRLANCDVGDSSLLIWFYVIFMILVSNLQFKNP